jgi:hypothetical protein
MMHGMGDDSSIRSGADRGMLRMVASSSGGPVHAYSGVGRAPLENIGGVTE